MGKQVENQLLALKSLKISNKTDELNQIKSIFPQNQINDLICESLKEINQFQNSIELNKLDYKAKSGKYYNMSKISLPNRKFIIRRSRLKVK